MLRIYGGIEEDCFMGWFSACGEIIGSETAAFWTKKAKLEQKELAKSNDFCPDEAKQFISHNLEGCRPASKDLTWWGRKITEYNLGKNNYFGTLLGIDANTKSTKRTICIIALKTAAKWICAVYDEDAIRAVTVTYKLSSITSQWFLKFSKPEIFSRLNFYIILPT